MLTVVVVEAVERRVHGFLSRHLAHSGRGVYQGKMGQRVFDELVKQLQRAVPPGRATIIRGSRNGLPAVTILGESLFALQDFDGLTLVERKRFLDPELEEDDGMLPPAA